MYLTCSSSQETRDLQSSCWIIHSNEGELAVTTAVSILPWLSLPTRTGNSRVGRMPRLSVSHGSNPRGDGTQSLVASPQSCVETGEDLGKNGSAGCTTAARLVKCCFWPVRVRIDYSLMCSNHQSCPPQGGLVCGSRCHVEDLKGAARDACCQTYIARVSPPVRS